MRREDCRYVRGPGIVLGCRVRMGSVWYRMMKKDKGRS
jgi:hypothetical protein